MNLLFLIEFYTNSPAGESGWEINHAWVYASDQEQAIKFLKINQGRRFDCVITCDQHVEIVPLAGDFRVNTPDANLFIIGSKDGMTKLERFAWDNGGRSSHALASELNRTEKVICAAYHRAHRKFYGISKV